MKSKKFIVVHNESNFDEKIKVPVFLLKHWKAIITLGSTIIVLLIASICIIITTFQEVNSQFEQEIVNDRIEAEKRLLEFNRSSQQNKSGSTKIDSTINKINEKMIRRGLSPIRLSNTGGPIETVAPDFINDYYEEAIKEIDRKISDHPLGVPHLGRITSRYGYRRNPFTQLGREAHLGIDFQGKPGDRIRATAKGKVLSTGYQSGYGLVIKIAHKNGYETRYAHLSGILVKPGQIVDAGTEIGLLGSTGRSTGPHIHYEILKNNKKINPEKYIYF